MNEKPKNIKIVFIGDEGVGKTSIIMRIEQGIFQENFKPNSWDGKQANNFEI